MTLHPIAKEFLLAFWWETVNLNMIGSAHQLLRVQQIHEGELARKISQEREIILLYTEFLSGKMNSADDFRFSGKPKLRDLFPQLEV